MTKRADARVGEDSEVLAVLLRRVAMRDEAGFATLYRLTSARLYGVVARILPSENGGAEALQDAFIRIWERAGDFDPAEGSPMAWMAAIARNRALDEARRVRPLIFSLEVMSNDFDPDGETVDPLAVRERSQRLGALIDCLRKLDDDKRAVLMLAYYHGASREALSKRFRRPVPTIKSWLRRGLDQLRGCLGCHLCEPDATNFRPQKGRSPSQPRHIVAQDPEGLGSLGGERSVMRIEAQFFRKPAGSSKSPSSTISAAASPFPAPKSPISQP